MSPPKLLKKVIEGEMYVHVDVCADLTRVLAYACAWENILFASS